MPSGKPSTRITLVLAVAFHVGAFLAARSRPALDARMPDRSRNEDEATIEVALLGEVAAQPSAEPLTLAEAPVIVSSSIAAGARADLRGATSHDGVSAVDSPEPATTERPSNEPPPTVML